MQGLLILSLIIGIVIFLMPVILSAVIFFIAAVAILVLLANFGMLPRAAWRRYGWGRSGAPRSVRRTRKTRFAGEEPSAEENESRRGGFHEDVEVITLPETALRKDERAGAGKKKN
jgi:hypothetical protein